MTRTYRITRAERARRRARILALRPWDCSTGPRTAAGKARSRLNGLKSGDYSRLLNAAWRAVETTKRAYHAQPTTANYDRWRAAWAAFVPIRARLPAFRGGAR